jgi:hypothetical protein
MKIKKEYIILSVLIFALAGYLLVKKNNQLHYSLPPTPAIAQKNIVRLEIINGGKKTILTRKDGAWFISPEDYPADAGKIERITGVIADFSLETLASESGDYLRYDLTDDKKITVQVFGEKSAAVLFSFDVGKRVATGGHTFVTIQGDKRVYQASGNFRSDFEQTAQDLRDKKILSLAPDTLTSLQFTENGKETKITKQAGEQHEGKDSQGQKPATRWLDTAGREIPEPVMNEFFAQLSELQCDAYPEGKKKEDLKNPIISLHLQGEKNANLSIFDKGNQKDKENPGLSSDNNYPFLLQTYKVEMIRKALREIRGEKIEPQPITSVPGK